MNDRALYIAVAPQDLADLFAQLVSGTIQEEDFAAEFAEFCLDRKGFRTNELDTRRQLMIDKGFLNLVIGRDLTRFAGRDTVNVARP